MANDEKLIRVTNFNTSLNRIIGSDYDSFGIYRSKGLLAHLLNRKHYVATMFEVKQAKIESYLKNGRLNKVDAATLS